ncbi:MAG: hypothetical protein ACFE9R_07420 [Candidatus Hermodarchaeota archaeon]
MTKCIKVFSLEEGITLPRLNSLFKAMEECDSKKLYYFSEKELDYDVCVIVGAKSREEAIDYILNITADGIPVYEQEYVRKTVQLWDDDKAGGSETRPPTSIFELEAMDKRKTKK